MRIRSLIACLSILCSIPTAAQLTSEYYLDKTTFAPGEPVFLYHRLTNHQTSPQTTQPDDPQQPDCSGDEITVSTDAPCSFGGCAMNGPPPTITLAPGKSNLGRYLLNYNHEINAPGNYWVQAEFVGNTAVARPPIRLTFRVDGNLPPWSAAQYQSWLDQLNSTVFEQRLEAARTLASLAPVSLETILLDFANHYDTRIYAPLALYRLNTPRSMEALAGLMKSPDSFTRWDAAHYLAESGDQKWYPLLLDAAQKNPGEGGVYLVAAAQLGGDRMLPVLAAWAKDNEHQPVRANVILAIEATHSRSAIPILLDLLNSRDHKTSDGAQYSLQRLTHRSAFQNRRFRNRKSEARKWQEWWVREGSTATIYKDLCEKPVPLP